MSFQGNQYNQGSMGSSSSRISAGMPKPTTVVKWLLIINIAIFVLQMIFRRTSNGMELPFFEKWFSAMGSQPLQVWRLITFQFLHANTFHLLFNMLGLYFLGPVLERSWGPKRFIAFYLTCGFVGGLLFIITSNFNIVAGGLLIGASGGVLGLLVACAILFPQFVVILLLFPVPIRFAAGLMTFVYILSILGNEGNAGGDLCHLGGMATGFIWVMGRSFSQSILGKTNDATSNRKQ